MKNKENQYNDFQYIETILDYQKVVSEQFLSAKLTKENQDIYITIDSNNENIINWCQELDFFIFKDSYEIEKINKKGLNEYIQYLNNQKGESKCQNL